MWLTKCAATLLRPQKRIKEEEDAQIEVWARGHIDSSWDNTNIHLCIIAEQR